MSGAYDSRFNRFGERLRGPMTRRVGDRVATVTWLRIELGMSGMTDRTMGVTYRMLWGRGNGAWY